MSKKIEKTYTPQEVFEAVRSKVMDLYKNSTLAKANTAHELEIGAEPNNDEAEAPEQLQVGEVTKPGQGDKKNKKKSVGVDGEEESEDSEDSFGEEPEHEEDMSHEEDKEHDAKENQEDEQDEDDIEADEEPEKKAEDKKKEDSEDENEKKDKKMPFQKSEAPLKQFMHKIAKKRLK